MMNRSIGLGLCAVVSSLGVGCEDPPPPPDSGALILGIRTELPAESNPTLSGGMRETLAGLTALGVEVTRIDVVHRTVKDDPTTERVITVDSTPRALELAGNLTDPTARLLAFLTVPKGFVFQVRVVGSAMSIQLRGETLPVRVPSGEQTGLKVEPVDGEPFEIRANERTGARIVFPPFTQLVRNQGQGFVMKPLVAAEHVSLAQLSNGMLLDEVVVRFEDGTSADDIAVEIAATGATVVDRWPATLYYRLRLPATTSLESALEHYDGSSHVRYVLPNTVLNYAQNDPQFPNQLQWPQVSLPQAYAAGHVGDFRPIVAVVDSGVMFDHPDLVNNIFVNTGELPAVLVQDTSPADGFMDSDFDHDGFITFADWNAPGLTAAQLALLASVGLTPPLTPGALVAALSDGVDDDDFDGDPTTFVDDLIGWDFGDDDNTPLPDPATEGYVSGHGTWVAGVAAAVGDNSTDLTGTTWRARILPVRAYDVSLDFGDRTATGPLRDSVYRAILYADQMGADVINASLGGYVIRDGSGDCTPQVGAYGLDGDKYDAFTQQLDLELTDMNSHRTRSLLVVAAGNCGINHDSGGVYAWPSELRYPSVVVVAGVSTSDALSTFSDRGVGHVDLAAPAEDFVMLDALTGTGTQDTCGASAGDCDGTSFAAPMVTGAAALLISADPALQGSPCRVADRIIRNGDALPALHDLVGPNGLRLDVDQAVRNAVTAPIRGCP